MIYHDYIVTVRLEDEFYPVSVFDATNQNEAIWEAVHSFSMRREDELQIISVEEIAASDDPRKPVTKP